MSSLAVQISGLHFDYPSPLLDGSPVPALRGIDLDLAPGTFCALMGPVGAGKSTLCLALNGAIPHAVEGEFEGSVLVCEQNTREVSMGQLAAQIGLVLEDVEAQLFSASVADEVAFGLEGLGLPPPEIEARIRSALELVGLSGLEQRVPRTLSGGEQKRLALASVLAMRPRLLILDEPTSGLDPRGRHAVLAAIDRLRRQETPALPRTAHSGGRREAPAGAAPSSSPPWTVRGGPRGGMTVVMATQDAEAAARFADRVLVLREGQVALDGSPEQVFTQVERLDAWGIDVPQLARLGHRLGRGAARCIFAASHLDPRLAGQALVREGFVEPGPAPGGSDRAASPTPETGRPRSEQPPPAPRAPVIAIHELSHRYPGAEDAALSDVDLEIRRGEWLAIVGINGSGKSTLIRHLNGLLKPTAGQVTVAGQDTRAARIGELARVVSYLPQNPGLLLFESTVRREIAYGPRQLGLRGTELNARVAETLALVGLEDYAEHPPAVLSYGLRRQVALASVLAMQAPVLALDEPATGLDRGAAGRLLDLIADRRRRGTTVITITHDLRWAARYAGRVAILSAGRLVACGPTRALLADLDLLAGAGLAPLPVTALAHAIDLSAPLPLSADEFLARTSRLARDARSAGSTRV